MVTFLACLITSAYVNLCMATDASRHHLAPDSSSLQIFRYLELPSGYLCLDILLLLLLLLSLFSHVQLCATP